MDAPEVRVDRMIEHATVLKGLFAEGPFSFAGQHYTITDLDGTPAPTDRVVPRILVAGGARRVLRFAGQIADIVGVNASIHSGEIDTAAAQDSLADRFDQKVGWVRDGAGDRFDELEINAWIAVASLTDDGDAVAESLAPLYDTDAAVGPLVAAHPHRLARGDRPDAPRAPGAVGVLLHRAARCPGPRARSRGGGAVRPLRPGKPEPEGGSGPVGWPPDGPHRRTSPDAPFVLVVAVGLAYFLSIGMLLPSCRCS